ncbi:MAG TPA: DUF1376 domain-containing protein [Bryobacteraceae bacterium]|jgi:uncharacterized protein YdaU (DUF1376 family)|nr:DUF1376 domain-containing protein [Bryobacteraceae bacterium]
MANDERYAAFLFYCEDWLSSTAIDLMTAAEERGYLRLLLHAWKNADCGLPNDDKSLAQLSKLGRAWMGASGAVVRAQFFEKDGRLYNQRLVRERENQVAIRQARSGAGKAGAESRWHGKRIATPMAKGGQKDASSNSISNSSITTNSDVELEAEKNRLIDGYLDDALTDAEWKRLCEICDDEEIMDRCQGYR